MKKVSRSPMESNGIQAPPPKLFAFPSPSWHDEIRTQEWLHVLSASCDEMRFALSIEISENWLHWSNLIRWSGIKPSIFCASPSIMHGTAALVSSNVCHFSYVAALGRCGYGSEWWLAASEGLKVHIARTFWTIKHGPSFPQIWI